MRNAGLMLQPHLRRGVGDAASDAQAIVSALQSAGVSAPGSPGIVGPGGADAVSAATAYTNRWALTGKGLLSLAHGTQSFNTVAPLMASALVAAGVVSPPVGAAMAVLIPLIGGLLGLAGGQPVSQTCTWAVSQGPVRAPPGTTSDDPWSLCFTGTIPYGPVDPTTNLPNPNWRTWNDWLANSGFALPLSAFPFYNELDCELVNAQVDANGGSIYAQFMVAYYTAWKINAEYAINGHPFSTPSDLLFAAITGWNSTHTGSQTVILNAQTPPWNGPCGDPANIGYIGHVFAGDVTRGTIGNVAMTPMVLNIGPELSTPTPVPIHLRFPPHGSPVVPSSTAKKVLVGAGVAAGSVAVGIGLLALLKHWSYRRAANYVWDKTGGRAKRLVRRG
jgi:hypothetical protein